MENVTEIESRENQGEFPVVYHHDRIQETTRGDIDIRSNAEAVTVELYFKPTPQEMLFHESIDLTLTPRQARHIAYQLLLMANQIEEEE
jgi:hypothetical protein